MKGKTSIVIAYCLATICKSDCIYVLGGGKIIEKSMHNLFSLQKDGAYSNLAKLQFKMA